MPRITAFDGYLVDHAHAAQVAAPAYDAASPAERRQFAEANPRNFLNTMRLREDFPPDAQPSTERLLALNKAKLDELLNGGAFNRMAAPCLFIYRLTADNHTQTGVVGEVSVDDYHRGRLRRHENTRSDKEDLLTMYQKVVGVSSSPICLAYPRHDGIERFLAAQTKRPAVLDFTSPDGVAQQVWRIDESVEQQELQAMFATIDTTYLTDGHHRAASGWRYAQMRRAEHAGADDASAPYNQLLVALFCAEQLSLLPFHRVVRDTGGMSEEALVAALRQDFSVRAMGDEPCMPAQHGEFGMLIDRRWYRLRIMRGLVDAADPVNSLDVSILQNHILAPLLGLTDMRNAPRLDYVSGVMGSAGLAQKCAQGWAVGFACHATSIAQLMTVADAGALMPPKSTYFDPKARSGIFIREK